MLLTRTLQKNHANKLTIILSGMSPAHHKNNPPIWHRQNACSRPFFCKYVQALHGTSSRGEFWFRRLHIPIQRKITKLLESINILFL